MGTTYNSIRRDMPDTILDHQRPRQVPVVSRADVVVGGG